MDGVRSRRQLDLLLSRATDSLCRQRHLQLVGLGRQWNFAMLRTRIEGGAVLRSASLMSRGYPSYSYSLTRMTSCPLLSKLTLPQVFGRGSLGGWAGENECQGGDGGLGEARLLKRVGFENSNQKWPITRWRPALLLICPRMSSDKRFKVRMTEDCGDGQKGKREVTRGRGEGAKVRERVNFRLVGRGSVLCLGFDSG